MAEFGAMYTPKVYGTYWALVALLILIIIIVYLQLTKKG
jgi:hypothetical protein